MKTCRCGNREQEQRPMQVSGYPVVFFGLLVVLPAPLSCSFKPARAAALHALHDFNFFPFHTHRSFSLPLYTSSQPMRALDHQNPKKEAIDCTAAAAAELLEASSAPSPSSSPLPASLASTSAPPPSPSSAGRASLCRQDRVASCLVSYPPDIPNSNPASTDQQQPTRTAPAPRPRRSGPSWRTPGPLPQGRAMVATPVVRLVVW
jgi:hypothetical protein